ncbi:type II toxin-antitoxin system RelE/ParE family toxin [Paenibacillus alvei]|uniref:Type II toxin-antitoxin system RelE/ParE family toxin n=1 Tax=Paenibacillus alvei TaxID=44250 RepID=A0ABT4H2R4_PAEAL|nr:type II toxin-antitoxin system RelE/ParE family toxin [Paenibacillus alvei]EJW13780.1 putative phage protein [Paenibacillus alvei DSM 29]MCY9540511.1 type II toxin-antitoxin system RelE/ParE family toxin [Paenibacillus alvei]MCY9708285.1 type II toxin-antitoxin system RelE/ParE family toxin [Paenibacillus alvei]MCY9732920.1 type II toxin-antitoxin system RelE/ParE family toxin [Paenibacillus alvei]MCY9755206.1 type II toxin-antitoxin system RelE/ParE family toxin [Paenibacillus alvei]
MYDVVLYEDARGESPMDHFITVLNKKAETDKKARILLKKVYYTIELLQYKGTRAGEKFTKQIDGKLWELRPDDHRVFFFLWNGNHIVLLHAFRKQGKKTPDLEIAKAQAEMNDWIERHGC